VIIVAKVLLGPLILGPVGWVVGAAALITLGVAEAVLHDGKKR
jgi:hypothetical protein